MNFSRVGHKPTGVLQVGLGQQRIVRRLPMIAVRVLLGGELVVFGGRAMMGCCRNVLLNCLVGSDETLLTPRRLGG